MSIYGQVISNIPRAGLINEISSQDLNLLSEDGINFRPHNRANHGVTPQDIEWIELRAGDGRSTVSVWATEFSGGWLLWLSKLHGDARFEVKKSLPMFR